MNADPEVMRYMIRPLAREESNAFIDRAERHHDEHGFGLWAVEVPPGLKEIVSFTVPVNLRSIAVMERLGMTRDPDDDFEHPNVPKGHPYRRHVLYRIAAP